MNAKYQIKEPVKLVGSEVVISIYNIINPDNRGGISYLCKWIDDNKQPHEQLYREEQLRNAFGV